MPAPLAGVLTPATSRLIAALEGFLRTSQGIDLGARRAHLQELLDWVVARLRHGEPTNLISVQLKAHLVQLFPSLAIGPASPSLLRDASRSARFFGLDFTSSRTLTASDRRFLRIGAQLLTLIEGSNERQPRESIASANALEKVPPSLIVRTTAEWQAFLRSA